MVDPITGLGAVKAAFDLAKSLKNINDATIRNGAVIELQEKILSAQEAQTALIQRVGDLEKEVANFEKWDAEKEKYELKEIHTGSYAYAVKENARGSEPPHLICANCYEQNKKRILQKSSAVHMTCPECKTRIDCGSLGPKATFGRTNYNPRSDGWT